MYILCPADLSTPEHNIAILNGLREFFVFSILLCLQIPSLRRLSPTTRMREVLIFWDDALYHH